MSEADKIIESLKNSGKKVEEFYVSNKTSDKNVGSIEDDVKRCNELIKVEHANWIGISNQLAISHILAEREQKDKQIKELEEYIAIAPNLDEMTATKYIAIQEEAYIRGKAEEQQKAEQIIRENYIPKQAVIDLIENETININGFECIAVEDLQELLEGERK